MKGTTPDEKLMVEFYRVSQGNISYEIDIKAAAKKIGMKETALKNIVKHLAQANFVKKVGETHVRITAQGIRFVCEELLDS